MHEEVHRPERQQGESAESDDRADDHVGSGGHHDIPEGRPSPLFVSSHRSGSDAPEVDRYREKVKRTETEDQPRHQSVRMHKAHPRSGHSRRRPDHGRVTYFGDTLPHINKSSDEAQPWLAGDCGARHTALRRVSMLSLAETCCGQSGGFRLRHPLSLKRILISDRADVSQGGGIEGGRRRRAPRRPWEA